MLNCRNCGNKVVNFEEAKEAVKSEYNYSDYELENSKTIRVWHPRCAIADSRIDVEEKDFYWEVV